MDNMEVIFIWHYIGGMLFGQQNNDKELKNRFYPYC